MAGTSSIKVIVGNAPLDSRYMRLLKSLDVEMGVHKQTLVRLKFVMGQESTGEWADWAEETFTPATPLKVDAQVGEQTQRLINAVITEFKMDFKADPCESQLEIVGMDSLEKVKRQTERHSYPKQDVKTVVSAIYRRQNITPDLADTPVEGSPNPNRQIQMQDQNDLEFLRRLANERGYEAYVESRGDVDHGFFKPLDISRAARIQTGLVANRSLQSNVRNTSFYYDLTGPTAVKASGVDAQGKAIKPEVKADLRDHLAEGIDKNLLGPPGFANVLNLTRHGKESLAELQKVCEGELERHSWLVVGRGDLDTLTYGDILIPRRKIRVDGVSSSFSGDFMVWEVTHTFMRDLYCQRFEIRKRLGVFANG